MSTGSYESNPAFVVDGPARRFTRLAESRDGFWWFPVESIDVHITDEGGILTQSSEYGIT